MDNKQIKELMSAMGRTGTKKIHIKTGDFELELEREDSYPGHPLQMPSEVYPHQHYNPVFGGHERANQALVRGADSARSLRDVELERGNEASSEEGKFITSPMVGTFYSSQAPGEPSFVSKGDKVEKGQVVCIIEAMKVMNEVKADQSGTVAEILVDNGHPVEFGSKLFKIT